MSLKKSIFLLLGAVFAAAAVAGETNAPPTLTLPDAQALALKNHPQIAEANYLALAAQEVVTETRAAYFPTVNAYGTAAGANAENNTRIMAGYLNNPSVFSRTAGGLQVNQLLTDFGRTINLSASSKTSRPRPPTRISIPAASRFCWPPTPPTSTRSRPRQCCTSPSRPSTRANCSSTG